MGVNLLNGCTNTLVSLDMICTSVLFVYYISAMNESRLKYKQTILLHVLYEGHVIWRSITAITYQHLLPDCTYQNTVPPGSILFFSVEKCNETINHLFPDIRVEQSASTCVSWPHFILLVTCYIPILDTLILWIIRNQLCTEHHLFFRSRVDASSLLIARLIIYRRMYQNY